MSLNIPGREKTPAGSQAFFLSIFNQLTLDFPGASVLEKSSDALGPYAIIALEMDPLAAKQCCMALEAAHPAARLVDLDVYSADGEQIGRARLGLPARRCLVCPASAVDCMRLKRHAPDEIIARTHELLSLFNA